jgi:SRSO17 transposase
LRISYLAEIHVAAEEAAMGFGGTDAAGEVRFATYVEGLASVIGHKDRVRPLRDYCVGLMMPCERKSVEPMAAVTAPSRTCPYRKPSTADDWLRIG